MNRKTHIVTTREGETVVKPRWCGDRIPVFKDSLDENSIDELLISLGAVNPQNTNIVTVKEIVNDCNNIIKSAAYKAGMFVYINPQKRVQTSIIHVVLLLPSNFINLRNIQMSGFSLLTVSL